MQFDLEKALATIRKNPTFLKTKETNEDNISHRGETTYQHCEETFEKSQELIKGDLITDPQAKQKFIEFINEKVSGIKRGDLLQIVALIHDCGKTMILNGLPYTSIPKKPGHGFWGSLLVPEILKDLNLPQDAVSYVANCVRLHLAGEECWSMEIKGQELLWQLKLKAENFHAEMIFNIYCDLIYNKRFQDKLHLPLELLNLAETYDLVSFAV